MPLSPLPPTPSKPAQFTVVKNGLYRNRILAEGADTKGISPQGQNVYFVDQISEGMGRQTPFVFYHENGKDEPSTIRALKEFQELFEPI